MSLQYVLLFLCFIFITIKGDKPPTYFPNLPLGEYKLKFKALFPCESTENHKLQYNVYFSKKTATEFELKGNMTLHVPFDDSVSISINMAVKSSIGGWKDNAHVYTTTNACSKTIWLFGELWNDIVRGFHLPRFNCPTPPGVYVTSGIDMEKLRQNNFPKKFFYGEYKMTFLFTKSTGEKLGCFVLVLDVIRPWE
ncbi:uncharacterized protein LOC126839386 [Adelges cooleyi]|uniref:uncharacterized protein LOC126839386 n=1 Tax=Adelges cooleyi TaxID=133065 RepID=UPI00217F4D41|nr:uncharacterized protein LOC126839386 [Adelges cooleyi]